MLHLLRRLQNPHFLPNLQAIPCIVMREIRALYEFEHARGGALEALEERGLLLDAVDLRGSLFDMHSSLWYY